MRIGFTLALITYCNAIKVEDIQTKAFLASATKLGKSFATI